MCLRNVENVFLTMIVVGECGNVFEDVFEKVHRNVCHNVLTGDC